MTVTSLLPGPTEAEFFEQAGMEDTAAGSMPKDDPRHDARDGIEALMAGKDKVVAGGRRNSVQAAASSLMPDRAAAKGQAQQVKPSGD